MLGRTSAENSRSTGDEFGNCRFVERSPIDGSIARRADEESASALVVRNALRKAVSGRVERLSMFISFRSPSRSMNS